MPDRFLPGDISERKGDDGPRLLASIHGHVMGLATIGWITGDAFGESSSFTSWLDHPNFRRIALEA